MSVPPKAVLAAAVLAFCAVPLSATERLERRFDARDGLPVAEVSALAQDTAGFIWIGTYGGLLRYDGAEMRLWGHQTFNSEVRFIVAGADREVIVGDGRRLFRVTATGLEIVRDASGGPLTDVSEAAFDAAGRLWIVRRQQLLRHERQSWQRVGTPALEAEQIRQLRRVSDGALYAITEGGVWAVTADPHPRKVFSLSRPRQLAMAADGSLVTFAPMQGKLVAFRNGRLRTLLEHTGRPIALARRGDTVWAAYDARLVALRSDEPPEVIGVEHGLISGGPLLVDREGGVWLGTFRALVHYPEPDVRVWTEADGLKGRGALFLGRTGDTVWVTGWSGLSGLNRSANRVTDTAEVLGPLCPDDRSELWLPAASGFKKLSEYRATAQVATFGCTRAPDGSLWMTTRTQLFRKAPGESGFRAVPATRVPLVGDVVRVDSRGRLWMADGERICHTAAAALFATKASEWSCDDVSGVRHIMDLQEVADGQLWMATRMGVFRRDDAANRWTVIPGSRALPSSIVNRLVQSKTGGMWVVGEGAPLRVVDRPQAREGWEVVERLSEWNGIPSAGSRDLLEDIDGTLWIATVAGLVQIPPEVRQTSLPAPSVELVDIAIDRQVGESVDRTRLRHKDNLVELRFAALSYRARGLLRYQVRHQPDGPWLDLNERAPTLRYVNLPFGRYQVELRASLDGRTWSIAPAAYAFAVRRPWYMDAWAIALFLAAAVGLLFLAHHVRVGFLLRMERQRVRIAMDLHDEVGSALGSIGLLASLAADERAHEGKRRSVAAEIADMAAEVGATLGDLVWAMRVRAETLDSLAYYIVERAGGLFPDATPALVTDFPKPWPAVRLSPGVRQNVLMIALEALHNAARHARAERVLLSIRPDGGRWRLSVVDDGVGLPDSGAGRCRGTGMFSMQRRAESIGGAITIAANQPSGTRVELLFDPQARERAAGLRRPHMIVRGKTVEP